MKRVLKGLGILLGVLVLVAVGFVVHLNLTYDKDYSATPEPPIKASSDPEIIKRGEYVVHAVAHCSICHVERKLTEGRKKGEFPAMTGGYVWDLPLFGHFESKNITPDPETGIGNMSDGKLARAIRAGVDRNGKLIPFMRLAVGQMSDEDLTAVVSYLRAQPGVKMKRGDDQPAIIGKLVAKSMAPYTDPPMAHVAPGAEPSIERGRYLANGPGICVGCHSPRDPMKGFVLTGAPFSGEEHAEPDQYEEGQEFVIPNLTPDPETGHLKDWTEDAFVARFDKGRVFKGSKMPWECFLNLTETDRRSLYRYLRSLPPTKHVTGPSHRAVGWKPGK